MSSMPTALQRPGLLGPLFWYEVTRQTRRGHGTLLRCLFVMVLLGAVYLVYAQHFNIDLFNFSFEPAETMTNEEKDKPAMRFLSNMMVGMSVGLLLVTPAYVATAMAEEKERGTDELLFTTSVTSH